MYEVILAYNQQSNNGIFKSSFYMQEKVHNNLKM